MTLTTIDHTKFIDRIYEILNSDKTFNDNFGANVIKGQPSNARTGDENTDMPWVNIVEADNPIVSKKVTARGNLPAYLITLEYWIVIHAREESSTETHDKLTQYATEVETIMQRYPQLSLVENDLSVRLISTRPVTKLVAPIGSPIQARNVMVSVEAYYQPINTPKSLEYLTGELSHTPDLAEALAIINDGNDGSPTTTTIPISVDNLNDGDKTTYVEIPPGETLTFDDGSTAFQSTNIWVFFQGQPNARIILRMHSSDGTTSFQSGELSPNAANNAVNAGLTGTSTSRVTQSVENTGTETAYYAGWSGRSDGSVPTDTSVRNFSNGELHSSTNRPFTSIPIFHEDIIELKLKNPYQISNREVEIYVNKDADAEFEISFTGEYAGGGAPSTRVYNQSPVDGVVTINDTNWDTLSRISIKITSITGATTIDFAGMRENFSDGVVIFSLIVDATPSEFPFDHDIDTSVGLATGVYFFNQSGDKKLDNFIVSSQDGSSLSITVSTSSDGMTYTQAAIVDVIGKNPVTYNFDKGFQNISFVKLVSTKTFRLHELNVLGSVIE